MQSFLQTKWISALLILVSIALIFNPILKFPFAFVFIIFFVLIMTYLQDGNLSALNFKKFGFRELGITIIAYLIMEVGIDFVLQPFMNWAFNEPADYSLFEPLKNNGPAFWNMMWMMWVSAAIGEEILFRGFLFAQLEKIMGNKDSWLFIFISSAFFAFPHFYQGITGVLLTFLIGLGFGFIYWKFKNMWVNILIHGFIDTVFLTLAYFGKLDFYEFTW